MKSITWRLIGVVMLWVIAYGATKNATDTTVITVVFHTLRFFLYYYHERVWEVVKWGRSTHPLSIFPVRHDLAPEDHKVIGDFLKQRKYIHDKTDFQI